MIPARIAMNGLAILLNAIVVISSNVMIVLTVPTASKLVIMSHDTNAANAPVPSWSSVIPTPIPIANSQAMLSMTAPPALTRKKPICCTRPTTSPPCIVDGHNAYPRPIKIPQIGRHATGSINALPNFCRNFIIPLSFSSFECLIPFFILKRKYLRFVYLLCDGDYFISNLYIFTSKSFNCCKARCICNNNWNNCVESSFFYLI